MITNSRIVECDGVRVLLTIDDRLSFWNGNYIMKAQLMGYDIVERIKGDYFMVKLAFDSFGNEDAIKMRDRIHKRKYYNG